MPAFTQITQTRALLLLADGKVAAERYADGYDSETRHISWSMAKTVTAVLIGMLVADGLLSEEAAAPIPAWQRNGDPRGEITLDTPVTISGLAAITASMLRLAPLHCSWCGNSSSRVISG